MADALKVALALGLILSFTARALTRIFLGDAATRANRAAANLRAAMAGQPMARVTAKPESSIIIPPTVRQRTPESTIPVMDWSTATADERATAILAVLPTHYEDANGVTAKDIAHRLGMSRGSQVAPTLGHMRNAGTVQAGWDKSNRTRRVYHKTAQ